MVIFTTAYSEYAVDGFKLDAVDYLLKPFEFQDLLKAADKARKQYEYRLLEQQGELGNSSQIKGDSLFVKSDYKVVRIDVKNIRYIEGMSEYVRICIEGEDKPVITLASLQKMEERAENGNTLPNVYFVRTDARELPLIFDAGEVDKIYLNFSDPWPKERHAKRRLTSRQFLERYDAILKSDGVIEFKTDNRPLFDFSLEEVNESKWHLVEWTYDLHHNEKMNVGNIMTEYEEKFSSEGNPIYKLIAAR